MFWWMTNQLTRLLKVLNSTPWKTEEEELMILLAQNNKVRAFGCWRDFRLLFLAVETRRLSSTGFGKSLIILLAVPVLLQWSISNSESLMKPTVESNKYYSCIWNK